MSSEVALKGVGANGKRRAWDFYPTPPECTHALIDWMMERRMIYPGDCVWEPACGNMAMVDVLESYGIKTIASDIQLGMDFLSEHLECFGPIRWIITNPPFSLSEQFIRRAAQLGIPFAFLLKSQYWHSAKRRTLFEEIQPAYVLPLTWRPDFTGQGASLMDMCWVIWNGESHITQYIPLAKPKIH